MGAASGPYLPSVHFVSLWWALHVLAGDKCRKSACHCWHRQLISTERDTGWHHKVIKQCPGGHGLLSYGTGPPAGFLAISRDIPSSRSDEGFEKILVHNTFIFWVFQVPKLLSFLCHCLMIGEVGKKTVEIRLEDKRLHIQSAYFPRTSMLGYSTADSDKSLHPLMVSSVPGTVLVMRVFIYLILTTPESSTSVILILL